MGITHSIISVSTGNVRCFALLPEVDLDADQLAFLSDRHFGVGGDGVIRAAAR